MLDRRTLICQQTAPPAISGIDFVQVVDHTVQTVLQVFFIVDPDTLIDPGTGLPAIVEAAALGAADLARISIVSQSTDETLDIVRADWISVTIAGNTRTVLEVEVAQPGDFSLYTLTYDDAAIDRFFATEIFSFKQGCPTGLDCKGCHQCQPQTRKDVDIDHLARDWHSLRGALLDFASEHYPQWEHQVEADQVMMLLEILAALGDEFSYVQDRYALEAYLATATQTQSIVNLAQLMDYTPDRGQAATTTLLVAVSGAAQYTVPRDTLAGIEADRVYALREDTGAIPFEVIERVYVHARWNEAAFHLTDAGAPCLAVGATEVYLQIAPPDGSDPTEDPGDLVLASPEHIWLDRLIVLRSGLGAPDEPNRAWAVTVTGVEAYEDPFDPAAGTLTRISWDDAEALPFEMPLQHGAAYFNAVRVVAGETVTDTFRIGSDAELASRFAGANAFHLRRLLELPRAVERQGACEEGQRGRVLRHGLADTPDKGLAWDDGKPVMTLVDIEPDLSVPDDIAFDPSPTSQTWDYVSKILDADAEQPAYTVESGLWTAVLRYRGLDGDVVHRDYAGNDGFTLRFGDRAFGVAPADATILQATYLSAPGIAANLPADTLTFTSRPGGDGTSTMTYAASVTNPFSINSAHAPETVDSIRLNAPQAWQAILLRAVRSEDYREILERRDDVQAARATPRWTGSWTTDFVAVDPLGTTILSPELRAAIEAELDCIRQAGRQTCLREPDYVPIDIRVDVCAEPNASNASLRKKITSRLVDFRDSDAFFHPDNLSFGDDLIGSDLEAAIQCVPGVRAVESIEIRRRGVHDFIDLGARVEIAPHQILQLSSDPSHPEWGFLEVTTHGGG